MTVGGSSATTGLCSAVGMFVRRSLVWLIDSTGTLAAGWFFLRAMRLVLSIPAFASRSPHPTLPSASGGRVSFPRGEELPERRFRLQRVVDLQKIPALVLRLGVHRRHPERPRRVHLRFLVLA